MEFRHTNMLKLPLGEIAQQTLMQACKICLGDVSCPQLHGKRVLGFDNTKAGDIVTSITLLNDTCDFSRPLFGVVILHQGTRVDKTPCGRTWGTSVGLQGPARCAVAA